MKKIGQVALLSVVMSLIATSAFAYSDACCGDPLSCFCFKAEDGGWHKGTSMRIKPGTPTKGLQFRTVLPNAHVAPGTDNSTVGHPFH